MLFSAQSLLTGRFFVKLFGYNVGISYICIVKQ